jgi:hypothetical protein
MPQHARGARTMQIYLIDEVHMLKPAHAFNALLKTLEEPRSVTFIFATTEAQKVRRPLRADASGSTCANLRGGHYQTPAGYRGKERITLEAGAAGASPRRRGSLRMRRHVGSMHRFFAETTSRQGCHVGLLGSPPVGRLPRCSAGFLQRVQPAASDRGRRAKREGLRAGRLISRGPDLIVAGVTGKASAPRDKLLILLDHWPRQNPG